MTFKKTILFGVLLMFALPCVQAKNYKMLVGTYTRGTSSEGIYALEFDRNAKLISKKLLTPSDNPSYLSISPDEKKVYAVNVYVVNETNSESYVCAYAFDKKVPSLSFLNKSRVQNGPCFITSSDKHVFTANYGSGTLSVFGRNADGTLTDTLQVVKHQRVQFGRGLMGPSNAHQIIFSPNGKFLMATNLGTDRVFTYRYKPNSKSEILEYVDEIKVTKGSGPRHLIFSKDGRFLYLVQELNAGLTVFSVNEEGKLTKLQETTLVTDSTKSNSAADIHLSPDGKYLYATNRAEANTITCFKVNSDGTVKFVEQYSTFGDAPRNFNISPDGKFVFVGNQKTNNITIFSRNKKTGKLKLISKDTELGAPVCLLFY